MLEFVFSAEKIKKNPIYAFFAGTLIALMSVVVSLLIFPSEPGLVSVFFITITVAPLITKIFIKNESMEKQQKKPGFFERHGFVLKTYTLFFLAVVFGLSFLFHFMPPQYAEKAFSHQAQTIKEIKFQLTDPDSFYKIFANNVRVSLISFLLSVVFGAGAVLILTWNASVIAVFVGEITRASIPLYSGFGSLSMILGYAHGVPLAVLSILLHGIPEIMSYFLSGLAGGMISVALMREKLWSSEFNRVLKDGILLLSLSLFLIAVAAFLETAV